MSLLAALIGDGILRGPFFEVRMPRQWQADEYYDHPNLALDDPFQPFPYPERPARR